MKYICDDEREYRSLGQAMKHTQDTEDATIYWSRSDQDGMEEQERYTGSTYNEDNGLLEDFTRIVRK